MATCRRLGLTLATAESCTGGLLAGAVTDVPGASAVFDRGYVTYSNAAKTELLGVPEETIRAEGAVSKAVSLAMARGARERAEADVAVAVTGVAGPGGSGSKPEGRVHFACASPRGETSKMAEFGAVGRALVRRQSVDLALDMAAEALEDYDEDSLP